MGAEWFGAVPQQDSTSSDEVVGVVLVPDSDGLPAGVASVTTAVAQAGRLAYGLALAADDGVEVANVYRRLVADGGIDAAVLQQALFFWATSVVRVLMADARNPTQQAARFRELLREFDSLMA